MKTLNTMLRVVLMIGLSYTITACDKKKDSQPSFARNNRQVINDRNFNNGNPRDPRNAGNIGILYNFSQSQLVNFLGLPQATNEIGFVSNRQGDSTGVYITGDISENGNSGRLNIYVWDDIANQTGEAYQVQLEVVNGQVTNQGADITLRDSFGTVRFDGDWRNGTWEGDVSFDNGQYLGRFITGECSQFRCP